MKPTEVRTIIRAEIDLALKEIVDEAIKQADEIPEMMGRIGFNSVVCAIGTVLKHRLTLQNTMLRAHNAALEQIIKEKQK